jgi:hypothetical protein
MPDYARRANPTYKTAPTCRSAAKLRESPKHSLDKSCSYNKTAPSTCRSTDSLRETPQAFARNSQPPAPTSNFDAWLAQRRI